MTLRLWRSKSGEANWKDAIFIHEDFRDPVKLFSELMDFSTYGRIFCLATFWRIVSHAFGSERRGFKRWGRTTWGKCGLEALVRNGEEANALHKYSWKVNQCSWAREDPSHLDEWGRATFRGNWFAAHGHVGAFYLPFRGVRIFVPLKMTQRGEEHSSVPAVCPFCMDSILYGVECVWCFDIKKRVLWEWLILVAKLSVPGDFVMDFYVEKMVMGKA